MFSRPQALSQDELNKIDSVWKAPGLVATLISVFAAFGGWALLLPVIPLAIIESTGSESLAGLSTGVFMAATVATQYFTPRILRSVGYFPVMLVASLLLGLPALVHVFSFTTPIVLLVAIIRGIGFGSVTVAEAALIADLVPAKLVGRSSGVFGFFVGSAQLIGFPLGMWVYDQYGGAAVFSTATGFAVFGALSAFGLPNMAHDRKRAAKPQPMAVSTWKLALVPGLIIGVSAVGFAAFSTFLAPAANDIDPKVAATVAGLTLAVVGATQTLSRIFAGWWADRNGQPGGLAIPALVLVLTGVLCAGAVIIVAPTGSTLVYVVLGSAVIYGLGFGVAQSEALLLLFYRLPRDRSAEASALWNMSFDSGTGIGAIVLGFVATSFAYQGAFFGAAIAITGGLGVVVADRMVGRQRGRTGVIEQLPKETT